MDLCASLTTRLGHCQAIDSFVATADAKFGPITIIRKDGKIAKKIPWSAFRLEDSDWKRVSLCTDILAVSSSHIFVFILVTGLQDANRYHQLFSADKVPTIHRVIPALESLCTKWENKLDDAKYALFHSAIRRGLDKLGKYYTKLDNSEVYVLSLCALLIRFPRAARRTPLTVRSSATSLLQAVIHRAEVGR